MKLAATSQLPQLVWCRIMVIGLKTESFSGALTYRKVTSGVQIGLPSEITAYGCDWDIYFGSKSLVIVIGSRLRDRDCVIVVRS